MVPGAFEIFSERSASWLRPFLASWPRTGTERRRRKRPWRAATRASAPIMIPPSLFPCARRPRLWPRRARLPPPEKRICRSTACRSRSRTISMSPGCRPRRPVRPSAICRRMMRPRSHDYARPARLSSARPISISSPPAWSACARLMAYRATPLMTNSFPADRVPVRRSRSQRGWCRCRSAPTPPALAVCRPGSTILSA